MVGYLDVAVPVDWVVLRILLTYSDCRRFIFELWLLLKFGSDEVSEFNKFKILLLLYPLWLSTLLDQKVSLRWCVSTNLNSVANFNSCTWCNFHSVEAVVECWLLLNLAAAFGWTLLGNTNLFGCSAVASLRCFSTLSNWLLTVNDVCRFKVGRWEFAGIYPWDWQ